MPAERIFCQTDQTDRGTGACGKNVSFRHAGIAEPGRAGAGRVRRYIDDIRFLAGRDCAAGLTRS